MKLLLQRVRQAGATHSRGALFIVFAAIFAIGAVLPSLRSKPAPQAPTTTPSHPSVSTPTSPDYVVTTFSGASFVPGITDSGNHCDDCSTGISLPFDVQFYDQTFPAGSTAYINSNGFLAFNYPGGGCCGACIPYGGFNNVIFVGSFDLYTADSANGQGVFTSISGAAPHRIFNIEWRARRCCLGGAPTEQDRKSTRLNSSHAN